MDKFKKYRKIRNRLETVAFLIAIMAGNGICSYLGLTNKKLISLDTALILAIIFAISAVFNIIAIRIADNWYEKNIDKQL